MRPVRKFHPPLWAWFATAGGLALFMSLAAWQFQRGQAKERWLAQFDDGSASVKELSAASVAPPPLSLQRAHAVGTYDGEQQLLQDGQSRGGRPGYHVWTPLRLASGERLLVNRGWIPQPYDPAALLPTPPGEVSVSGWWRSLPEPGIRVGEGECRKPDQFPAVVVYPTRDQVQCALGGTVLPGLLLLDLREPGGFVREWTFTSVPPQRHYGYAVTWFGLGLTAVILFIVLNLKRDHDSQT